jgi:hypothetical protein
MGSCYVSIFVLSDLVCSANEHTQSAGKKTIMPADVFRALEDIEFGYLRDPLEAEFASESSLHLCVLPACSCTGQGLGATTCGVNVALPSPAVIPYGSWRSGIG